MESQISYICFLFCSIPCKTEVVWGYGVPQDYEAAVKWYMLAAEQGFAEPQGNLATMYAFHYGVPLDYVYAHMCASIAATYGNKLDAELRPALENSIDALEERMTRSQLATARELARECVRKEYKGC